MRTLPGQRGHRPGRPVEHAAQEGAAARRRAQRAGQLGLHLLQAEPVVALHRAEGGPGEDLERDVGADRVAGQREDRHPVAFRRRDRRGGLLVPVAPETAAVRFLRRHRRRDRDGPEPLRHPRLHGHLPERDRAELLQRRLDHVVLTAHADPAGGDHQVGPDQLVLDGRQHPVRVVGQGDLPVRQAARLPGRGGQHEAVGVPDPAGNDRGARLGQLVAGGEHHHPGPRPDQDRSAPGRRDHRDVHRPQPRARGNQHLAGLGVLPGQPDRVAVLGPGADAHPGAAAVGPLHGYHGLGAVRQHRPGHDLDRGTGLEGVRPGVARRDLGRHRQRDRVLLGGVGDVLDEHRVPVHARVVERGQRADRGHILGQHQAVHVTQAELGGSQRGDGAEDLGEVLLDRGEGLAPMAVPVSVTVGHGRLSRYLRSQGTISSARSERSQANWTSVRR